MKNQKEKYVIPRIEIIEVQLEECIAASFGTGAANDVGRTPGLKTDSFWKTTHPFLKEE